MLAGVCGSSLMDPAAFATAEVRPQPSSLAGGLRVLRPLRTAHRERPQGDSAIFCSCRGPGREVGGTGQQRRPAGAALCLLWVLLRATTALPGCGSPAAQGALGIMAVGI